MSCVSGRQILGARDRQEDAFRVIRQDEADPGTDLLILLADGMGGHVGGEVASRLVVDVFERHCITLSRNPKPAQRLREALEAANAALRERILREPDLAGMGSTLVAAMKLGSRLYWLSVGDSILYLLRDGQLRRLNADHSVFGELIEHVREGRLTQQEAESHPRRNALRSALIGDKIALIDANSIALQPGDVILAASDGLETLSERRVAELLSQPDRAEPKAMTADLLTAVEGAARPRQDNTTVVAYRYDPQARAVQSTESLFRAPPSQSGLPPVLLVGGGAVGALALAVLVYAIGWGGAEDQQLPPAEVAAPAQPAAPLPPAMPVAPRAPSLIDMTPAPAERPAPAPPGAEPQTGPGSAPAAPPPPLPEQSPPAVGTEPPALPAGPDLGPGLVQPPAVPAPSVPEETATSGAASEGPQDDTPPESPESDPAGAGAAPVPPAVVRPRPSPYAREEEAP